MKKILFIFVLAILLCGCELQTNDLDGQVDDDNSCMVTYCDAEYGIEYLRDTCIYKGGLAVRLDKNGNVIHCEGNK